MNKRGNSGKKNTIFGGFGLLVTRGGKEVGGSSENWFCKISIFYIVKILAVHNGLCVIC